MPESGDGRVVARPLDWSLLDARPGPEVFGLYQRMMKLRKEHPALRGSNFHPSGWDESRTVRDSHGFGIDRANNIVVYHRWGDDGAGKTERLYVVLNFSQYDQDVSFEVPSPGPWTELIGGGTATAADGRLHVRVGSNWGAVYHRAD
jgi:pullulanase/glycogen debranching enzyme